MNESKVTAAFGEKLPDDIYVLKVSLRRGCKVGVADSWYSGPGRDLWVEWKQVKHNPRVLDPEKLLSKHQVKWCQERRREGRNVIVAVKTPKGFVTFDPLNLAPIQGKLLPGVTWDRGTLLENVTQFLRGAEGRDLASLCSTCRGDSSSHPGASGDTPVEPTVPRHRSRRARRAPCDRQRLVPDAPDRQGDLLPRPECLDSPHHAEVKPH